MKTKASTNSIRKKMECMINQKKVLIQVIQNKDLSCFSLEELKEIEIYIQLVGERKLPQIKK